MRKAALILILPLFLAACDQSPPQPANATPATQPAAAAPATAEPQPAAQSAAPVAEADTAPLFGTWAADLAWCNGGGEGSPITISANSFQGAENSCDITSLDDNGDGSFTASLTCRSQGQSANERVAMTPIFGPTGEGVRLSYLDRGGDPVNLFRCRQAVSAQ